MSREEALTLALASYSLFLRSRRKKPLDSFLGDTSTSHTNVLRMPQLREHRLMLHPKAMLLSNDAFLSEKKVARNGLSASDVQERKCFFEA